jgi:K+-transporting ATPase ATPase A chain
MGIYGWLQFAILVTLILVTMGPIGRYIARVLDPQDSPPPGEKVFGKIDRFVFKAMGVSGSTEQSWSSYVLSLLAFTAVSILVLYSLLRLQGHLPYNPTGVHGMSPVGAFNAAVSFVTNTNWQWFAGEASASHLIQLLGFTVQNFLSAAVGLAVAVALIRGLVRGGSKTIGNFWSDLLRISLRILLPLAFVAGLALASQGVVQNLHGNKSVASIDGKTTVVVPGGQVASQEAIKELGTNGGGFYNANSAHPFENPNGLTNILEIYLMLIIPFSLTVTLGKMSGSRRQGRVLLAVMMAFWALFAIVGASVESHGNPTLAAAHISQTASSTQGGGNMQGKEVRFGSSSCALFASSTTGTSSGAVNCSHESLMPLTATGLMVNMMLGEVTPGGIGMGLVGILINALLAVFIAGLMVGRTPEFLGKKIQASEMKLVVMYILAVPLVLLGLAAYGVLAPSVVHGIQQPLAHGLSDVLYNFSSAANNNGSSFGSVNVGTNWWNICTAIAMLVGRFMLIIPVLALAGSLGSKKKTPVTSGTFPTDTFLFGALLAGVIVIVAGLTYFPALALGPIVEHLSL